MTTIKCTKRAWVRTPGHPAGFPAPGRINCPCGKAPETMYNSATGNIACPCGTNYTWNGHIIEKESVA
jgi:hypothetical protein